MFAARPRSLKFDFDNVIKGSALNEGSVLNTPDLVNFKLNTPEVENYVISKYRPLVPLETCDIESFLDSDEEGKKLASRREKNRIAAAKCRQKKLEKIDCLQKYKHQLLGERQDLQQKILDIRKYIDYLHYQLSVK